VALEKKKRRKERRAEDFDTSGKTTHPAFQ
jgi:hypothetical protein